LEPWEERRSVIILGIDPGLANTGWGLVEVAGSRFRCLGYGCISTPAGVDTARRLKDIHDGILGLVALHGPAECAIETLYFKVNVKSAFATGQARGVALLATADAGLPVGEYGPGEVKLAVTGTGSADKKQVQYMVRAILGLAEQPKPDHAADALALAICHANSRVARARVAAAVAAAAAAPSGAKAASSGSASASSATAGTRR
jgi:crossover junction endodeoxyribonuclease RuvC